MIACRRYRLVAASFNVAPAAGLAGCGASSPAALPNSVDYGAPARPLNVVVALDPLAVQEVDMPITGANGTRYALAIPGHALRSPTRIRMQAISALGGAPAGIEAVHGAQLEPGGLHFIEAASLTIEPVVAVPIAQQSFFGYQDDGADLHPIPGELGAAARFRAGARRHHQRRAAQRHRRGTANAVRE